MNITIAAATLLLLTALPASAQKEQQKQPKEELREELTVRYEEAPEIREYHRLSLNPELRLQPVSQSALQYSYRQIGVDPTRRIATMPPVAYADSIYSSPYRGYAALGFLPKFNVDASAGYKVFDTDHTRLNAFLQYNASVYSAGKKFYGDNAYYRRHTATVGANLHQAVGKYSYIDLGLDYTFAHYNTPGYIDATSKYTAPEAPVFEPALRNQNVNRFNVSGLWTLTHRGIHYGASIAYQRFAYNSALGFAAEEPVSRPVEPLRQNRFDLGLYFFGKLYGANSAGVNVAYSYLNSGHNWYPEGDGNQLAPIPQENPHVICLHPYYRFDIRQFRLDLGINVDLRFKAGKVFSLAPHASATWLPSQLIKLYVKATGGTRLNSASTLYDAAPYAAPFTAYRPSEVPVDIEAGFTFGQWRGLYAEVQLGYSYTTDWLMPVFCSGELPGQTAFAPVDLKGYHVRLAAGYNWKGLVDAAVSVELAPSKRTLGYYQWRDRASRVITAEVTYKPLKQLDVNLGFEHRGDRKQYYLGLNRHPASLGAISNLKLGGLYRITERWSAFLQAENLLNHKYVLIGAIPAQGLTGLIGATYKF